MDEIRLKTRLIKHVGRTAIDDRNKRVAVEKKTKAELESITQKYHRAYHRAETFERRCNRAIKEKEELEEENQLLHEQIDPLLKKRGQRVKPFPARISFSIGDEEMEVIEFEEVEMAGENEDDEEDDLMDPLKQKSQKSTRLWEDEMVDQGLAINPMELDANPLLFTQNVRRQIMQQRVQLEREATAEKTKSKV